MLRDVVVRQARGRERPYKLSDERGLFLLVKPNGSRWWRLKYRFEGKEKLLSFGIYPDVTLAQARTQRDAARSLLAQGIDPSVQRKADELARKRERASTFRAVSNTWYELNAKRWAPATASKARTYLDRVLLPVLGDRPITSIRRRDLIDLLAVLENRGTFDIAKKCREWLGGIFRYAVVSEFIDASPATELHVVAAQAPPTRHQPHLSENELPEFLQKLDDYRGYPSTVHAIKLLLLTACRPGEVRFAKWEEIDLGTSIWSIPAERMKMRRSHVVPLPRQAVVMLHRQQALSGHREHVFPGRDSPRLPASENTFNSAMRRMGYHGKQTAHGFRHLISTALNERGYNRDWIERQLAHGDDNEIRAVYNKAEYLEQRRTMMQEWADCLEAMSQCRL